MSGPMGVKAIVNHLNGNHIYTRNGGRWGIGQLHRVLTRRTYMGEHQCNKRYKRGEVKTEKEVVTAPVPPLIDRETFDAVQSRLQANNPKVTPPRVVSGPNLLTGICYCGNCGGAMTLRTGKSGRYRYYACSIRARQGATGCKGRAIPMDKLDRMVVNHIEERLLDPERIEDVLASLLDRRQEGVERRSQHIAELNQRAAEADMRLKRLHDAIESSSLDPSESALGERIAGLTALRDQAHADATRIEAMLASSTLQRLTGAAVRELADEARRRLRLGRGGYRREHVLAFAQRVEVADDAIYIKGNKNTQLRTLVATKGGKSAATGVPGFIPRWRRDRDSNPGDGFPPTHFPGVRLRPLGHLSVARIFAVSSRALQGGNPRENNGNHLGGSGPAARVARVRFPCSPEGRVLAGAGPSLSGIARLWSAPADRVFGPHR